MEEKNMGERSFLLFYVLRTIHFQLVRIALSISFSRSYFHSIYLHKTKKIKILMIISCLKKMVLSMVEVCQRVIGVIIIRVMTING